MNVPLLINIAKALLLARWKQTLVAAVGVTFGITMFVALLSFMTGLNDMLDGLILNRTPHVRLYNEVKPNPNQPINNTPLFARDYNFISTPKASSARLEIYNIGFIMQSLAKEEKVLGFTPRITAQAFFNYGTLDLNGIVNGIDVQQEMNLFAFKDYIIAGNPADLKHIPNSIILGKALAETMLAKMGDVITITTASGTRYALKMVGIFQSGINEIDKVQSYASISTTQKILNKPKHYITDVAIKMKDISDAPTAARQFAQVYQTAAEDIQTANAQFETGTRVRMIISYAVGITLLIVAGFGIFNILNMMIYEKMDSIAILKATGFSGSDVKKIFLVISLGIGFFGGLAGLLFGFLLSQGIHKIPFNTEALPTVKTYPINNDPIFYMIAISFSLITTYFAGVLPARKAGKVDPVVIIRGK
jgi:lipoprotein-releasing system permease protein